MERVSGVVVGDPSPIAMRGITSKTVRAVSDSSLGHQATSTRASIRMTNAMGTERCTGQMEVATRVNGSVEFSTGMDG